MKFIPAAIAVIQDIGTRSHMEDTYFLDCDFSGKGWVFGGVYDGHAGKEAAEFAARHLHERFLETLPIVSSPEDAFIESYQTVSDELCNQNSGACAANFFIRDGMIYYANVGDARIIVVGDDDVFQLTVDHRIDDPIEKKRIIEAGGEISPPHVCRGDRGLMPTRTIGDEYFKPVGIIATPSVGRYLIIKSDLFLVAGTDGLFDVLTNREVAEIALKQKDPDAIIRELKRETLIKRGGRDNLTIIVLSFK